MVEFAGVRCSVQGFLIYVWVLFAWCVGVKGVGLWSLRVCAGAQCLGSASVKVAWSWLVFEVVHKGVRQGLRLVCEGVGRA